MASESETVYVLVASEYDYSRVAAVYSTRDAAEEAKNLSSEETHYNYRVEEFEVSDEPTAWEGRI